MYLKIVCFNSQKFTKVGKPTGGLAARELIRVPPAGVPEARVQGGEVRLAAFNVTVVMGESRRQCVAIRLFEGSNPLNPGSIHLWMKNRFF